jgi:hypothetical protein
MTRFATVFAVVVVSTWAVMQWRGVNLLPTTEHSQVPADVRSSPGGYRSYHTYHGFRGGK